MKLTTKVTPFTQDDDAIRRMVEATDLPSLLAAAAYATGDLSILTEDVRPPASRLDVSPQINGGMTEEAQRIARERVLPLLLRIRDEEIVDPGRRPDSFILEIFTYLTHENMAKHLPALIQELGVHGDTAEPDWTLEDVAPDRDFKVIVIGGGISGVVAGVRLTQAGIPFVILEKNPGFGGGWWENTYPGCRLDTSNYAYSFSFAQRTDWPNFFSPQHEVRDYVNAVADRYGLQDSTRFESTVTSAQWDEGAAVWRVTYTDSDGAGRTETGQALISAVGQLNIPNTPTIPGQETFTGRAFHTARWPDGYDVAGKKVAVVGTGASGYQMVPAIVDDVDELFIFQRSAPWMLPTSRYLDEVDYGMAELFEHVPYYAQWYRFWQFWIAVGGRSHLVKVDPAWTEATTGPTAVSADNAHLRDGLLEALAEQYADRPDLLEKVTPRYPAGEKRMLRDNGDWARAVKRPNVHLITDTIDRIDPDSVVTADGIHHEVDTIVYATGFHAADILSTITVTGRDGHDLQDYWDGDARAYLGVTVPGFPNFFCLYGPNTGLSVTGSIIFMSESAMNHVLQAIRHDLDHDAIAIEVKEEPFVEFNDTVDAANRLRVWGAGTATSWYKNTTGRVTSLWPLDLLEYWSMTHHFNPAHYTLTGVSSRVPRAERTGS